MQFKLWFLPVVFGVFGFVVPFIIIRQFYDGGIFGDCCLYGFTVGYYVYRDVRKKKQVFNVFLTLLIVVSLLSMAFIGYGAYVAEQVKEATQRYMDNR